jgi:acyl transferase domain-containing protein
MGRQLLEREPVFRTTIERCDTLLRQHAEWSLLSELMADESHSRLHETAIAQPAIFALQVALAALWKSWGVEPDAVVGHSVGEMAAAHISGALSLEDAVLGIVHRGRCMDRASSQGKMLAVGLTREEASSIIQGYEDQVSVAAVNSPSAAALSGDPEVLEHIAQSLRERDVFCRFLPVQYAFHSPRMEPVRDELLAALDKLDPRPTTVPMISTVTGQCIDGRELDNAYWWQNVRQCVRFAEAVEQLIEQGANLFVELSPHPVLSGSITECCTQRSHPSTVLPSLRQHEDESLLMVGTWGAL